MATWKRTSSTGHEAQPTRVRSRGESDIEKDVWLRHASDDDDDDEPISAASSRSTSSAHKPMLNRAYTSNGRSSFLCRFPNSIMRWCCLGLAATLVIFVLSLFQLSWSSAKAVDQAVAEKLDPVAPPKPLWESFEFLERYYGGIRSLVPVNLNKPEYPRLEDDAPSNVTDEDLEHPTQKRALPSSLEFNPYPDYRSSEYTAQFGEKVECFLDAEDTVKVPRVRMYDGVPNGFPDAVMGSAELLGMRNDVCFDRFGRLGPYGLGYSINRGGSGAQQEGEREGADEVWEKYPEVDFRQVKWAGVQHRCAAANAHRFRELSKAPLDRFRAMQVGGIEKRQDTPSDFVGIPPKPKTSELKKGKETLPRTAVVIRTWHDFEYLPEHLIYLRSVISELSIMTGGEYTIHFLIHVKENDWPIFSDDETYNRLLRDSLPEEFRGMGTLWNERQMHLMYGGLEETWMRDRPVHGVYRSTFMPMQYFAYQHPEYDYFWNWEMDIRSTNHWYHLFDRVITWARKQPRKLLWERNSRFYVPFKHGSWEDFSHMVRIQTESGTNTPNNIWSGLHAGGKDGSATSAKQSGDRSIWGPERPLDDNVEFPDDVLPPTSFDKDKYEWGVGEEADLITFNPLFDPDGTTWLLADDTTGYNITRGRPPRRTAIITASRLSRKLLLMMHRETNINHHSMFSEMWPASCALHHGLKVVYAPHAEYIDRKWPIPYLESTFNAGRNGATGGSRTSVFGDREHNFRGTTWYYNAGFPEVLWQRWLGMKINNGGGELEEVGREGRMCLPGMLLHPIKDVRLVEEGRRADQ